MATNDDKNITEDDDQMCCIEATVVSGFEECARGEAKEKFNTDVKSVRGKITWKVPVHRVKEVITMGSIDNCRVVINSIPHFGFTDQYDSLSRLQKMVPDFDWEGGLSVWRKFNEFPYPIPSKPDVVPSREDLIDVVIMKNRAQPKSSKEKKKKGGRGKKKDKVHSKAQKDARNKDIHEKDENLEASRNGSEGEKNKECEDDGVVDNVSVDENGTKKVVLKRLDPSEPSPEIEIKVLIPGPNESVFPTDVSEKDQRDEEPMDVDHSMLQSHDDSLVQSPSKSSVLQSKGAVSDESENGEESQVCPSNSQTSPFKQPSAPISILSSAKDFASSVIEKLTSTHAPSPSNDIIIASSPSCVTPPPTPVKQYLDFFMKQKADCDIKSTPVDDIDTLSEDSNNLNIAADTTPDALSSNVSITCPSSSVDKDDIVSEQENEQVKETDNSATLPELLKDANENPNLLNENTSGDIVKEVPKKKERDPTKPTFRVTCNRSGDNHAFDSASAAATLGSAIIRYFDWSVDLKNFDIEVMLNIDNEEVTVSLGITKTSLHNRNMVAFGPTTLRATICYNMLRLCRIKNGDFVCDPMCGTSAIPIEGSLKWFNCFHFGGDYHEMGIARSLENIAAIREKRLGEKKDTLKIGTVQWNMEHFPLRDNCVDVFVSDLPFGHRMGSRTTNRTLYPILLSAMARTARAGARACLLTEDKTSLIKALQTMGRLWQRRVILSINMGGLSGFVFLITRTTASFSTPSETPQKKDDIDTSNVSNPEECKEDLQRVESEDGAALNIESETSAGGPVEVEEKDNLTTFQDGKDCGEMKKNGENENLTN